MSVDCNISTIVSESSDSASGHEPGILGRLLQAWRRIRIQRHMALTLKTPSPSEISPHSQFLDIFGRIEKDKTDLDQVIHDIEVRFLAMGTCVRELASLSKNLLTQSERLANSSGTEFKTHLQEAFDVIRQQLDFVGQYQENNAQLIGRLANYMEQFQRLSDCESDLGKILTPMQTVSVLFKIHCVSLGNEEKSFFEALTEEIVALQVQARTTFSEQMRGLLATGQSLSESIPHLKEQSQQQSEKVSQKKVCIQESMGLLQQQFEQMHASHEQLSLYGKNIKAASVGAVMGLQYQDITRQKWEHVAAAVQEMRDHIDSASGQSDSSLTHEPLVFLRDVGQIQVRQLQAIQGDLGQSQTAVSKSIHDMLEQLRGMDTECQRMCGQNDGSTAIEAMVKVLLETLAEVRVWVSDLATMASTTCSAVSSFDKTASDVSGTLRRLSASIGMIAINAQVQVARIGHENGLDVLAESVCTSAKEIKEFSETVGTELDGLVHELHETIIDCRKLEEKTSEQQRWLRSQGQQQDGQLHTCRDGTLSVQREVSESLKKIHEQATSVLGHADFHDVSQEGFRHLQDSLEECTTLADQYLGAVAPTEHHSHVHTLKKRYTMESEREVFEAAVAERKATSRSIPTATPAPIDSEKKKLPTHEEGAPEPMIASTGAANNTPEAPSTPQPVIEVKKEIPAAPATASDNKSDLGNNVELF